jgi:Winged helix DNA-binding domain
MTCSWDDLAGLALGRQFPSRPGSVPAMLAAIGPVQSQTARSVFLGLAARFPGVRHAEVTAAYTEESIVRGSTIRGTVHTATAPQYAVLSAATQVGQRALWQRALRLERSDFAHLWSSIEAYATDWRTPEELTEHLREFLAREEGHEAAARVTGDQFSKYLAFGHGALVRRPATGSWSGQSRATYRTMPVPCTTGLEEAVRLHLASHGPASRHDLSWWSGLGLRAVDEVLDRLGLVGSPGPDGRTYLDLPDPAPARALQGVRLLPEFDALMCGYEPSARQRFGSPEHLRRLWLATNGLVLPPLLVDGRITGYWRATGSARTRPLDVTWFAGTRRPRRSELDEGIAALEAALDIAVSEVTISREVV